jgi:nucleoside-diphosphate-sugar epimerase
VIHLAAVSRVIWGEREPELCRATNVGGLRNVLEAAASAPRRPWIIFASSREVYGQPEQFPTDEDCPAQPVNVYGRSKVEGELLVEAARRAGLRACTVRLSNVFGSTTDHADRVVPAFARGAASGHELRVDGADHTFDFTHVDDVAAGLAAVVDLLADGGTPPPPIHFVSGVPTTLDQLAQLAIRLSGSPSTIRYAPPRDFDVVRFFGSTLRAEHVLGWTARVSLAAGLRRLIQDFRDELGADPIQELAP